MRCSEEIENKILLKRKLTEFSFDNMVKHFRSLISDFPDKRTGSNTRYTMIMHFIQVVLFSVNEKGKNLILNV